MAAARCLYYTGCPASAVLLPGLPWRPKPARRFERMQTRYLGTGRGAALVLDQPGRQYINLYRTIRGSRHRNLCDQCGSLLIFNSLVKYEIDNLMAESSPTLQARQL